MSQLAASGPSAYWYMTRSTGAVALVLLTVAVALGVADVQRWSTQRWPRFLVDSLHRNVSLLAMVFLVLALILLLQRRPIHKVGRQRRRARRR